MMTKENLVQKISQIIYDKKGLNILALDVSHFSMVTDYLIIAEGNVDRHVSAIGNEIMNVLRDEGIRPHHVEGLVAGEWVLIDYSDVIVHLFMPEMRERYKLEQLWNEGKIVKLDLILEPPKVIKPSFRASFA